MNMAIQPQLAWWNEETNPHAKWDFMWSLRLGLSQSSSVLLFCSYTSVVSGTDDGCLLDNSLSLSLSLQPCMLLSYSLAFLSPPLFPLCVQVRFWILQILSSSSFFFCCSLSTVYSMTVSDNGIPHPDKSPPPPPFICLYIQFKLFLFLFFF